MTQFVHDEKLIAAIEALTAEVKRLQPAKPVKGGFDPIGGPDVIKGLIKEIQRILGTPMDGIIGRYEASQLRAMGLMTKLAEFQ